MAKVAWPARDAGVRCTYTKRNHCIWDRRSGTVTGCAAVVEMSFGLRRKHDSSEGETPGKERGAGAHPSSVTSARAESGGSDDDFLWPAVTPEGWRRFVQDRR
jgi:hypothetical protein